ncbi:MAG: hypothetical protein EOO38_20550, partial [Cytophagaceae bacterium]
TDQFGGMSPILLPMLIASMGIVFSIIATFFVRISESAGLSTQKVQNALNMGNWGSMVLTAIGCYFLVNYLLPETMTLRGHEFTKNGVFGETTIKSLVLTYAKFLRATAPCIHIISRCRPYRDSLEPQRSTYRPRWEGLDIRSIATAQHPCHYARLRLNCTSEHHEAATSCGIYENWLASLGLNSQHKMALVQAGR